MAIDVSDTAASAGMEYNGRKARETAGQSPRVGLACSLCLCALVGFCRGRILPFALLKTREAPFLCGTATGKLHRWLAHGSSPCAPSRPPLSLQDNPCPQIYSSNEVTDHKDSRLRAVSAPSMPNPVVPESAPPLLIQRMLPACGAASKKYTAKDPFALPSLLADD